MDEALQGIVEAAERGVAVPRIALFTGSLTVFGLPISSGKASELMKSSVAEAIYRDAKPKRREREEASRQSWLEADAQVAVLSPNLHPNSGALSLGEAILVSMPSGEQVMTPAVRVPLAAVNAWFVGSFESKESSGGGFFGFVSMPLGD